MAHTGDIALMAHLMRRAGFGAGRDELEERAAKGYDAAVEELLNPEVQPPVDPYTLLRYQPSALLSYPRARERRLGRARASFRYELSA